MRRILLLFILTILSACNNYGERTIVVPSTLTIKFDAMNGWAASDNVSKLEYNSIVLPEAHFDGYYFDGWFSEKEGGELAGFAGEEYIVEDDETLYARWRSILRKDAGDTIINGIVCVLVEAGTFVMGSPESEVGRFQDEEQHEVVIDKSFWISKYPITNLQYYGTYDESYKNFPITGINWDEAMSFAEEKGGFLPTEAQWEFAARGGNKSAGYVFAGSNNIDDVAWYISNSNGTVHEVGTKLPNELGLYDFSGNVYEWVLDQYGDNTTKICRGGGFDAESRECRVADRPHLPADKRFNDLGFRIGFE